MTKVTIAFIGIGKYFNFFPRFYAACMDRFLVDCARQFLVFTDAPNDNALPEHCASYQVELERWPLPTLKRYTYLLRAEDAIRQSDWFVYLDADMLVNTPLWQSDLFDAQYRYFGVAHPGFYGTSAGTFDENPQSRAYVSPTDDRSMYWQACLWGGKPEYIIPMLRLLARRSEEDMADGVTAVWYDESHLNRFFIDHRPYVNTLDPGFAFPECEPNASFARKIIH